MANWGDILGDWGTATASGVYGGVSDILKKKRELEAFKELIPPQMDLYKQQRAIQHSDAMELLRQQGQQALEREIIGQTIKSQQKPPVIDIMALLAGRPSEPNPVAPVQTGQPGYGVGEQALSGIVPQTQRVSPMKHLETIFGAPGKFTLGPQGATYTAEPATAKGYTEYTTPEGARVRSMATGEQMQLSPPVKTGQPWTEASIAGMLSGAVPLPAGVTKEMVEKARDELVGIRGATTAARVGGGIEARASRADLLAKVAETEALARRSPAIIQAELAKADGMQRVALAYAGELAKASVTGRIAGNLQEVGPGLSGATALEAARTAGRPFGEGTGQQIRLFENTLAAIDTVRAQFSDDELVQYAGWWNRGENFARNIAARDPKFLRFLVLNEHLRSTAFQYGGKQLTPFEAAVVFGFTPHGREIFKELYLQKMSALDERTQFELERARALGATPKGAYRSPPRGGGWNPQGPGNGPPPGVNPSTPQTGPQAPPGWKFKE